MNKTLISTGEQKDHFSILLVFLSAVPNQHQTKEHSLVQNWTLGSLDIYCISKITCNICYICYLKEALCNFWSFRNTRFCTISCIYRNRPSLCSVSALKWCVKYLWNLHLNLTNMYQHNSKQSLWPRVPFSRLFHLKVLPYSGYSGSRLSHYYQSISLGRGYSAALVLSKPWIELMLMYRQGVQSMADPALCVPGWGLGKHLKSPGFLTPSPHWWLHLEMTCRCEQWDIFLFHAHKKCCQSECVSKLEPGGLPSDQMRNTSAPQILQIVAFRQAGHKPLNRACHNLFI